MRGRFSVVVAGFALAVGGGVAGAVVVAPALQPDAGSIAVQQAAEKEALASLQHTFHVAKKARGMARGARQLANGLVDDVGQAQSDATQALATINSTKTVSDTVNGLATVDNATAYDSDPASPGPTVTVTVPESGLIEVSATVRFETDGAVGLFEDGNLVPIPGQEGACTGPPPAPDNALIAENFGVAPITMGTPPSLAGLGGLCGTAGAAAGPIVLKRSPGVHTYQLRYSDCGCSGAIQVTSRTLQVAPQL